MDATLEQSMTKEEREELCCQEKLEARLQEERQQDLLKEWKPMASILFLGLALAGVLLWFLK